MRAAWWPVILFISMKGKTLDHLYLKGPKSQATCLSELYSMDSERHIIIWYKGLPKLSYVLNMNDILENLDTV